MISLSNVKSCIVNSHSLNRKISKPLSINSSMVFRMTVAYLDVSIFHLLGQLEPQAILDELRGVLLHRGRGHRWQVAREGIWRWSEWLKRIHPFERTELGTYFRSANIFQLQYFWTPVQSLLKKFNYYSFFSTFLKRFSTLFLFFCYIFSNFALFLVQF